MSKTVNMLLAGLVAASSMSGCASAHDAYQQVFGSQNVISRSNGGDVDQFTDAAKEIIKNDRKIIIDGPCISACVIFADIAAKNICITPRAVFQLHKVTIVRTAMIARPYSGLHQVEIYRGYEDPPLSPLLKVIVEAHGGINRNPDKFITIQASEVTNIWPICKL